MKNINFDNIGVVKTKLSDDDYAHLLKQCLNKKDNPDMLTGVSEVGVAKHKCITNEKSLDIIKSYIFNLMKLYYEKYPSYLKSLKMIDSNLPIKLSNVWINYQKAAEYIPLHFHDGVYSFNIWMKIPYNSSDKNYSGNFVFSYKNILGENNNHIIQMSSSEEGSIILFPSKLEHVVYPFYNNKGTRISIAGNLSFSTKL